MEIYLAIITTVLVITQIVRVTQNAIHNYRDGILFNQQCKELKDIEVTKRDFERQRLAYELLIEFLERENLK